MHADGRVNLVPTVVKSLPPAPCMAPCLLPTFSTPLRVSTVGYVLLHCCLVWKVSLYWQICISNPCPHSVTSQILLQTFSLSLFLLCLNICRVLLSSFTCPQGFHLQYSLATDILFNFSLPTFLEDTMSIPQILIHVLVMPPVCNLISTPSEVWGSPGLSTGKFPDLAHDLPLGPLHRIWDTRFLGSQCLLTCTLLPDLWNVVILKDSAHLLSISSLFSTSSTPTTWPTHCKQITFPTWA